MIQIRGQVYRGVDGFRVGGKDRKYRQVAIHVKHLSTAMAIRDVLNDDKLDEKTRQGWVDKLIFAEEKTNAQR